MSREKHAFTCDHRGYCPASTATQRTDRGQGWRYAPWATDLVAAQGWTEVSSGYEDGGRQRCGGRRHYSVATRVLSSAAPSHSRGGSSCRPRVQHKVKEVPSRDTQLLNEDWASWFHLRRKSFTAGDRPCTDSENVCNQSNVTKMTPRLRVERDAMAELTHSAPPTETQSGG